MGPRLGIGDGAQVHGLGGVARGIVRGARVRVSALDGAAVCIHLGDRELERLVGGREAVGDAVGLRQEGAALGVRVDGATCRILVGEAHCIVSSVLFAVNGPRHRQGAVAIVGNGVREGMHVRCILISARIALDLSNGVRVGARRGKCDAAKLAAAAARNAGGLHAILTALRHGVCSILWRERKAERSILGGVAGNGLVDRRIACSRCHAIAIGNRASAGHSCNKLALAIVGHIDLDNEIRILGLGPAAHIFRGLGDLVVMGARLGIGDLAKVDSCRCLGLTLYIIRGARVRVSALDGAAVCIHLGDRELERLVGGREAVGDAVGLRQEHARRGIVGINLSAICLVGIGDGAGAGDGSDKLAPAIIAHDNLDDRLVARFGPAIAVSSGLLCLVVVRAFLCKGERAEVDDCRGCGLPLDIRDRAAQRNSPIGNTALLVASSECEVERLVGRREATQNIEILGQERSTFGPGVDGHIIRAVVVGDAGASHRCSKLATSVISDSDGHGRFRIRSFPAIARRGLGHLVGVGASSVKGDAAKVDGLCACLIRVIGDTRGRPCRSRSAILRRNREAEGIAAVVVASTDILVEEASIDGVYHHRICLVGVGDGRIVALDIGHSKLAVIALGDLHRDDVIAVVVLPALGVRSRGLLHVELVGAFGEELDAGEGDRPALAILDVGDALCAIRNLHAVGIVACSGDLDVSALVPVIAGDLLRCSEVLWCRRIIGVGECDMVGLVGL